MAISQLQSAWSPAVEQELAGISRHLLGGIASQIMRQVKPGTVSDCSFIWTAIVGLPRIKIRRLNCIFVTLMFQYLNGFISCILNILIFFNCFLYFTGFVCLKVETI